MIMPQKEELLRLPENWDGCEEYTETMLSGDNWRLERIISRGHVSPEGFWYEQNEDEWGRGAPRRGRNHVGRRNEMHVKKRRKRAYSAKCRHRVSRTSENPECIWLCFFAAENKNPEID